MTVVRLLALSAVIATAADAAVLPMKPGSWVMIGDSCKDFAFASQFDYDGNAFSYPHATHCRSVIRAHSGRSYTIDETCTANGDGSRADPFSHAATFVIASPTRIVRRPGPGFEQPYEYRWCGKSAEQAAR